jgi:hypothetical protein
MINSKSKIFNPLFFFLFFFQTSTISVELFLKPCER